MYLYPYLSHLKQDIHFISSSIPTPKWHVYIFSSVLFKYYFCLLYLSCFKIIKLALRLFTYTLTFHLCRCYLLHLLMSLIIRVQLLLHSQRMSLCDIFSDFLYALGYIHCTFTFK